MPFDFIKQKVYTINYNQLFNELLLSKSQIFENSDLRYNYFKTWILALKKHDKYLIDDITNNFEQLLKAEKTEPEIFQQPIHFNTNTILFHFRISYIKKLLLSCQSMNIPLDSFVGDDASILWTPIKNLNSSFQVSTEPLIAVPYVNQKLLIDGNHRLTKAISLKKKSIDIFFINMKSIIDCDCLTSSFDLCAYLFFNEINEMNIKKITQDCSDDEMVKSSYLYDSIYHF